MVENEHWKLFLNFLKPAFVLPSSYKIGNGLLQVEFKEATDAALKDIKGSSNMGIITDGWTNVSGDGIINFMVTTPKPVFYLSINRETNRETADYVSGEIVKVIVAVGSDRVYIVVADCAANMVAALRMVSEQYPHISGVGCSCHGLQNYMHDIGALKPVKKLIHAAKSIIKEIKYSHVKLAFFKKRQSENYGSRARTLKLPPKTRFSYNVLALESLISNKSAIQETVINSTLKIKAKVRARALDEDNFWPNVSLILKLLKPIATGLLLLESDSATLSDAFEVFKKVESIVTGFSDQTDYFGLAYEVKLSTTLKERFGMAIKPIHFAANLVDPRFQGKNLTPAQRVEAYKYLKMIASHLNLDEDSVIENLGLFLERSGPYAEGVIWKAAENHKPATWWSVLCSEEPLAPIATKILRLPCANIASERNWSQQGDVHSNKRNRLKPEKVRKLVAVKAYLNNNTSSKKKKSTLTILDFLSEDLIIDDLHIEFSDEEENSEDEGNCEEEANSEEEENGEDEESSEDEQSGESDDE